MDLREAARYPAVAPHAGTYARRFGEGLARELGVEFNIAVEARGWGVLKAYVEVGLGISVVPDICVRERDPLSVIPLREYVGPQSFGFFAGAATAWRVRPNASSRSWTRASFRLPDAQSAHPGSNRERPRIATAVRVRQPTRRNEITRRAIARNARSSAAPSAARK